MSAITNERHVAELLRTRGTTPGEPPVVALFAYAVRGTPQPHYAVFWREQDIDLAQAPEVEHVTVLLGQGHLTPAGLLWLAAWDRRQEQTRTEERA